MPVFPLRLPGRDKDFSFGYVEAFELVSEEFAGVGGVFAADDALAAGSLFLDLGGTFEEFLHG